MTRTRTTILALAAVALAIGLGTNAYAFHTGGVAECSGCHSMHQAYPGGTSLLLGKDESSTCLGCHQNSADTGPSSYHISTADATLATGAPLQRSPGGDFGWLKKTYTWAGRGGVTEIEAGQTHGHNIIALQGYNSGGVDTTYNYVVDSDNATAPGGSYPSASLGCTSCHDQHGQFRRNADNTVTRSGLPIVASGSYGTVTPDATSSVGAYRILAGNGYTKTGTGVTFTGVPTAIAPSTYNQTEATNQVKVAYGRVLASGTVSWSEWCGTCHGNMHYNNGSSYVHPTDEPLGGTIRANYNSYVKTGTLTGVEATAFTSLVPLVYDKAGGYTYTDLISFKGNASPTYAGALDDGNRVDCLSCHRAHASGWEFGLRWNPEYELLTDATGAYFNSGYGGRGHPTADVQAAYYDRSSAVFAKAQRSLCNKCHIKD